MEDFLKSVSNVGFPIAVTAYLLIRIEGKIDDLSNSIKQLATIISVKFTDNDGNSIAA